jgi:hypothetical protein
LGPEGDDRTNHLGPASLDVTRNEMRIGQFALIMPVMTSTGPGRRGKRACMARLPLAVLLVAVVLAAPAASDEPPPARPPPAAGICGDPRLVGRSLPAISDGGGCGIARPVSVTAAAGVALDPPAVVNCGLARALATWLERALKPGFADKGARVEAVAVVDAYSCRNRNRAEEGELSEHALGGAIDVGGFRLDDGTTVTVLEGWASPEWGATLRRLHAAGCGTFGTVLGPEANPLHADHLHFDVESRRSGPYCR